MVGLRGVEYQHCQGFDETVIAFKLVADISNRLHLLQITERENAGQTLQHWFWENERWSVDDNLEIGSTPNIVNYSLDSAITHRDA